MKWRLCEQNSTDSVGLTVGCCRLVSLDYFGSKCQEQCVLLSGRTRETASLSGSSWPLGGGLVRNIVVEESRRTGKTGQWIASKKKWKRVTQQKRYIL